MSLLPRAESTCEWIFDTPQFGEWFRSDTSNVLLLKGGLGCGKTTLVSRILKYVQGVRRPEPTAICAFFCSDTDVERQKFTSLMRSILSQLFRSRYDLLSNGLSLLNFDRLKMPEMLQDALLSSLRGQQKGSVVLIVDGIDRLDAPSQGQLLRLLGSLPEPNETEFWSRVRILLSIRSPTDILPQSFQNAILDLSKANYQARIQEDISRYVKADLNFISSRLKLSEQRLDRLESNIHKYANNFFRTSLVLQELKTTHISRGRDLERLVRETLGDLQVAYHRLLNITLKSFEDAQRLLHILATAFRPLTLEETGTAFAVDKSVRTIGELEENRHSEMKLFILGTLGPLVSIQGNTVQLVHQSFKSYLLKSVRNVGGPRDVLFGTIQEAHSTMSNLCIDLLSLQELGQVEIFDENVLAFEALPPLDSPVTTAPDRNSLLGQARELDFFEYASCYWADHLASAGLSVEAKTQKVLSMVQPGSIQLQNWTEKYRHSLRERSTLPKNLDALNLAVYFKLNDVLAYLLKNHSDLTPIQKEQAFLWAARTGNFQALKTFDLAGLKCTAETLEENTALHWAAQNGHLKVVQFILKRDPAWIQRKAASQRTALMLASANGHSSIVRMLSEAAGVDVTSADIDGWTPLMFSLGSNMDSLQLEVFGMLVNDFRVSLLHRDLRGRTILSYAAEYDAHEVIKIMINLEHSEVRKLFADLGDNHYGRSPLSYAAYEGNVASFELLLKSGLVEDQVRSRDAEGRSFVTHAADRCEEGIIQITKKYHQDLLDAPENNGRTPLSAAYLGKLSCISCIDCFVFDFLLILSLN